MGVNACKSDACIVAENDNIADIYKQGHTFHTFEEGEHVKCWSTSQEAWLPGKIAIAFSVAGKDGELEVTAGTYKVIVSGQKKYVGPEQLLKVRKCGMCQRPAATGFVNCCRTCAATRGRVHGPNCDAAYDAALAPPGKSPEASRVPSEDAIDADRGRSQGLTRNAENDAAPAPPEMSPEASRVPSEDAVDADRGRSQGPTRNAENDAAPAPPEMSPEASRVPSGDAVSKHKKQKCRICRKTATLRFGVCCNTCQDTQGRSHGPACDAACDAAPPEMSPEASQVPIAANKQEL